MYFLIDPDESMLEKNVDKKLMFLSSFHIILYIVPVSISVNFFLAHFL